MGLFIFSFIPSFFSGFSVFPTILGIFLTLGIFLIIFAVYLKLAFGDKKVKAENEDTVSLKHKVKLAYTKNPLLLGVFGVYALAFSIFIPLAAQGTCMAVFTMNYGVLGSYPDATISTSFTRTLSLPEMCKVGPPCHVYATIPEDGSKYAFINVHTHYDVTNLTINYDTQDRHLNNQSLQFTAQSLRIPLDYDTKGRRAMHTALLKFDHPNTMYYLEINYDGQVQWSGLYKTLPADGNTTVNVVMGGDVGTSLFAQTMTSNFLPHNPSVIFVGGDAAYDNGMATCWYNWDLFIKMFEDLSNSMKVLVPVIVGVGNHDVGYDPGNGFTLDPNNYPTFLYLFPQHLSTDTDGNPVEAVPTMDQRRTYFYHKIGGAVILGLDSNYVVSYNGPQASFIEEVVGTLYPNAGKFAYYHVPIYPACHDDPANTDEVRRIAHDSWVQAFQHYSFDAIYENHVHLFKKTKPITDGALDEENGVVYFGDGNWGITPNECFPYDGNSTAIMEVLGDTNHVWILQLSATGYTSYAINVKGERIYESNFTSYKHSK